MHRPEEGKNSVNGAGQRPGGQGAFVGACIDVFVAVVVAVVVLVVVVA